MNIYVQISGYGATERLSKNKLRCHQLLYQEAVLRIQIRDPVPFRSMDLGFLDPGSRIPNPQSLTLTFESSVTNVWVKSAIILCQLA